MKNRKLFILFIAIAFSIGAFLLVPLSVGSLSDWFDALPVNSKKIVYIVTIFAGPIILGVGGYLRYRRGESEE
jgi:hypothetical protein